MPRRSNRQLWADKLSGKSVPQATTNLTLQKKPFRGIVLGIDPSLRGTGIALLQFIPGEKAKFFIAILSSLNATSRKPIALGRLGVPY